MRFLVFLREYQVKLEFPLFQGANFQLKFYGKLFEFKGRRIDAEKDTKVIQK